MILVDTSVWVDHLRHPKPRLVDLLEAAEVACHPFIIGELVLGNLSPRSEVPSLLVDLPVVALAEHGEAMSFVSRNSLAASGIGWVDVHLLCSAALSHAPIWTLDRRLASIAARLGLAA